jgi:hypothetical protein
MRLYGAIEKVEAQSDGTVRVYGIASSEAVDEQGEIVRAEAMRVAIPGYMHFPALREMHQLSAAGTTLEAEVGEDGTTRIVAHVVDPIAVAKVKNQVYRGFSIGGRVTQRDPTDSKIITGLVLNEISLVDRPANPAAIFDCWKALGDSSASIDDAERSESGKEWPSSATLEQALERFNSPTQIWACGFPEHRHLAKADAVRCLEEHKSAPTDAAIAVASRTASARKSISAAGNRNNSADHDTYYGEIAYADPGYQSDGKKRYPIDTERHIRAAWNFINKPGNAKRYTVDQLLRVRAAIISAWKERINKDGPPSAEDRQKATQTAATKALWDVCSLIRVGVDLERLADRFGLASEVENDDSLQQFRVRENIAELQKSLNAFVADEATALLDDTEADVRPLISEMLGVVRIAAGAQAPARLAALLQKGNSNMRDLATALLTKAAYSQADQALLDLAYLACDKCLKMGGLPPDEAEHMDRARDHLHKAGAVALSASAAAEPEDNADSLAGYLDRSAQRAVTKLLFVVAQSLGKREREQQHIMDIAHECLRELTDGTMCGPAGKIGLRHSKEAMLDLEAAHRHLVMAGAKCDAAGPPSEVSQPRTDVGIDEDARAGEVAKRLAGDQAEEVSLAKIVGEIMPMLERLTKRVDDIARTPLPPLTMAKNSVSVSKQQDHHTKAESDGTELSPDAIAAGLAKMSKEAQTLTLIKASYANPIRVFRSAAED